MTSNKLCRVEIALAIAYVLITVDLGYENEVRDALLNLEEVKEAYSVYGVYDVVVKLEIEDMDQIKRTIFEKIRKMKRITGTVTLLIG